MAIEGTQLETLERWLTGHGIKQLSPRDTAHFIRQAAAALQHSHDRGMLYLDVKPQNFLVRPSKTRSALPDVQLFDISTLDTVSMKEARRPPSQSQGTPLYMAPEQFDGQPCAASDQYALAIVTYQLLTGKAPFSGTQERIIQQHRFIAPPPPSSVNKYLSPAIDAVVLHALEKQPRQRFASVTQFAKALEQAIAYTDLRSTLTLNRIEAVNGTQRIVTLPGKRQVTVNVPAGVQEQQVLRIEGEGEALYEQGPRGPLFLIIAYRKDEPPLPSAPIVPVAPAVPAVQPLDTAEPRQTTPPTLVTKPQSYAAQPVNSIPPALPHPVSYTATTQPAQRTVGRTRLIAMGLAVLLILSGGIIFALYQYNHRALQAAPTLSSSSNAQSSNATATAAYAQSSSVADATATAALAQANPNPYGQALKTLQLLDPLSNNQGGGKWEVASNAGSSCQFSNGAYHITTSKSNYSFFCSADAPAYIHLHNFVYEAQMAILQGDAGGIGFRLSSGTNLNAYYLRITQNGLYALILFGATNRILVSGTSTAIHTGHNQKNTLAVAVIDNRIDLYINQTHITEATDSTYTQGQIALVANDLTATTEIAFNTVRLWG